VRSFTKTLVIIFILLSVIWLTSELDVIEVLTFKVTEEQMTKYSGYYYNQLDLEQKKMYIKLDEAVNSYKEKVILTKKLTDNIHDKVLDVFAAYFYDNPECYYISNEYNLTTRNYGLYQYAFIELTYTVEGQKLIEFKNQELQKAADDLINSCIKPGMTDFEKEKAIHDELVKKVSYYEYKDIDNIPALAHTAYGALVDKRAVCDGYSKAYKLVLDKLGIESIIISGVVDNLPHAWNLVKLDGNYYHVDVTSDKLDDKSTRYVVHTYFNVTDEEILDTHTINGRFDVPKCDSKEYDYYVKTKSYIEYEDNLYDKLSRIISIQKGSQILEFKADSRYSARSIIDMLYELDFAGWRSKGKTSVSYSQKENIYIFVNSK